MNQLEVSMRSPRFSEDDLWIRVQQLYQTKGEFFSVVRRKRYTIDALDEHSRSYKVKYESGRKTPKIPIRDLFAVYQELYKISRMTRDYLKENGKKIVRHERYSHAPGATIFAILPKLDDAICIEKGGDLTIAGDP